MGIFASTSTDSVFEIVPNKQDNRVSIFSSSERNTFPQTELPMLILQSRKVEPVTLTSINTLVVILENMLSYKYLCWCI